MSDTIYHVYYVRGRWQVRWGRWTDTGIEDYHDNIEEDGEFFGLKLTELKVGRYDAQGNYLEEEENAVPAQ